MLRELFAEQTTPAQVVTFILVLVSLALVVAALTYAVIMSFLWATRLRPKVSFGVVFLPTREQLVEYAGEYVLAIGTSVLLGLTLATRHAVVEAITNHQLDSDHVTQVQALLPHLANPARALTNGTVGAVLLQPLLEAGRNSDARAVVNMALAELGPERLNAFPTRPALVIICVLMMTAYLGWITRVRYRQLRNSDPKTPEEPEYARTLKGLLTLAACVAILLLSPTLDQGAEAVTDSVIAAARVQTAPPEDLPLASRVRVAIEEDRKEAGALRLGNLKDLRGAIAKLGVEHTSLLATRDTWQQSLEALSHDINLLRDSLGKEAGLESLSQLLGGQEARLKSLEAWHAMGTLVVFVGGRSTYTIVPVTGAPRVAISASKPDGTLRAHQHRLPPGTYIVSLGYSARARSADTVHVKPGEITVLIPGPAQLMITTPGDDASR